MHIYNTKTKTKTKLEPINNGEVSIYLCGPTVYDDAHLGHARSAVSFDILNRTLIALGYSVKFARNYTDIDDKIIKKMQESKQSLEEITKHYISSYEADMAALNVLEPSFKPKATEYLKAMINLINALLEKGVAYKLEDGIYFNTKKDKDYLSLSSRTDIDTKARVDSNASKHDEKDFALWKFDDEWYDAVFGKGRPGWHTECVAMIADIFSKNSQKSALIDIHAGGVDLLFPHHENEAAQCRCGYHGVNLSNLWMHNGFININNQKMSKSLGNSFFLKDALALFAGEVIRFYLISSHYRAHFNYTLDDLSASKKRLDKLYRLKKRIYGTTYEIDNKDVDKFKADILEALKDDLNTSKALAILDEKVKSLNEALDANQKDKLLKQIAAGCINVASEILGIGGLDAFMYFQHGVTKEQKERIQSLIAQRSLAKSQKDYAKADLIRAELEKDGIIIQDTLAGTMWERV